MLERTLCCEDESDVDTDDMMPCGSVSSSDSNSEERSQLQRGRLARARLRRMRADATTRVVSQAPMRSEPGSTTVVSQTPARSEPQLCRATNLDSLTNGTGAYQQKPDENVITPDDQFSDPSRHRSKIYEPISSRSQLPFLKGDIVASKSELFQNNLESCCDTESPALSSRDRVRDEDAYHEGDCRLVPCSICPIGVVDRVTCVGGVSLLRGVVSQKRQALSSEEPSSTCSAAHASEHRFRGTDHGPIDCHAQADDRWIEISGDWPITLGSLGFSKEELIEATGKYENTMDLLRIALLLIRFTHHVQASKGGLNITLMSCTKLARKGPGQSTRLIFVVSGPGKH